MSSPKEIFNKYAKAYQERFMDLELYNDTYDVLCTQLGPNAEVLEIGCGPGNITNYLLSKRPDLRITAIDIAENMVALAKENCPSAIFKAMDCRNISSIGQKFNAVVCGFCLPYLNKEETAKLITDSSNLMASKGIIYLSAIEGDQANSAYQKSSDGQDGCFIYYYEESDLRKDLRSTDFGEPMVFRKKYDASTHLVLIAHKK